MSIDVSKKISKSPRRAGRHSVRTVRALIGAGLEFLGIEIDDAGYAGSAGVISSAASRVTVHVIRTDEEQMIAKMVTTVLNLG